MGNVALTLLILLLLQLLVAVAWLLAAWRLDMPRTAAVHWSASALLGALAIALVQAREAGPAWLTFDVGGLLMVASMLLMGRGLRHFLGQPAADAEAGALLVLVAGAGWVCNLLPVEQAAPIRIAVNSSSLAWVLARAAIRSWPPLRLEFSERTALFVTAPLLAGVALGVFRLGALVLDPTEGVRPLPLDSPPNLAAALVMLLLYMLLQVCLATAALLRMVHKLRLLSQRDSLTGLVNRAEWLRQLDAQHRWLGRYGEPYAVLMIDVDHFKSVNDTWGHAAGDAVLISIAQLLMASARDVDVIGRVGGEEFCVLLPRADPVSARRIAERLRQAIADTEFAWRQQAIGLTVSIGLAMVTDADETPQQVMHRVDMALYQAKRGGRNRTSMANAAAA